MQANNTDHLFYNDSINLAYYHYNKKNFIEARKYLHYVYQHFKDDINISEIYYKYANTYYYEKEYEKCEKIYKNLIGITIKKNEKIETYKILLKLISTYGYLNKFDEYINASMYLLKNYQCFNKESTYNDLQFNMIGILLSREKYNIAEEFCHKLLSYNMDNNTYLFSLYYYLTIISYKCNLNNLDQSHESNKTIYYYNLALNEYQKNDILNNYKMISYLINMVNWNNTFREIDLSKIPESEFISESDFI
jgi:tetratricopeptide (TPR) repeat protein